MCCRSCASLALKSRLTISGSEYSSFDYIRAYWVNHLKIAQSFINRSTTDPESAATIRAIVGFAHDVGISVIAQGVETQQLRAPASCCAKGISAPPIHHLPHVQLKALLLKRPAPSPRMAH